MGPETVDWTYAISTLLIRFVGIFVVLGLLQVVMQITGRIFAHLDAKEKVKALTQEQAAAVGMALHLYDGND
jgi:hypothetical protein